MIVIGGGFFEKNFRATASLCARIDWAPAPTAVASPKVASGLPISTFLNDAARMSWDDTADGGVAGRDGDDMNSSRTCDGSGVDGTLIGGVGGMSPV